MRKEFSFDEDLIHELTEYAKFNNINFTKAVVEIISKFLKAWRNGYHFHDNGKISKDV